MSKRRKPRIAKTRIRTNQRIRAFNEIKARVIEILPPQDRILTEWREHREYFRYTWHRWSIGGLDIVNIHSPFRPGWEHYEKSETAGYEWTPGLYGYDNRFRTMLVEYEELYRGIKFPSESAAQREVDNILTHIGFKFADERAMCLK